MARFGDRLRHAWNAFTTSSVDPTETNYNPVGYSTKPDRRPFRFSNERTIISSIYTRLSVDFGQNEIKHVRLDDKDRYSEDIDSGLNSCLTLEANIDQGAGAFRRDIALSLFDNGVIAMVPVDTTLNPNVTGGWDVNSMRVANIVEWYPSKVKVDVYNETKMRREQIILDKSFVAIVENPLYPVMNDQNSTLQRLIRKLNLLDAIDEQSGSGKLDLIIQVPYTIKSEARRQAADQRRQDIELQLSGSKYGIAYTDGTEKVIQLNRPAENNLLTQVQYLIELLYSQLGLTPEVMNGTADEATMLNYMNRTIRPLLDAVVESMNRSFLTKTARTQKQRIMYFHDPFKIVPISAIAVIADKLSRNKILTGNEIRGIIGYPPSKDAGADKLVNSNMPTDKQLGQTPQVNATPTAPTVTNVKGASQNGT